MRSENILIYAIRGTDKWWSSVGENMKPYNSYIVSDIKGKGNFNVVDDFYKELSKYKNVAFDKSILLSSDSIAEIIARCRVLRNLETDLAEDMVNAMAHSLQKVIDSVNPVAILAFPIDRYVSDVLEHLARIKSIPFYELTVSPIPDMGMLTKKGVLMTRNKEVSLVEVDKQISKLTKPFFAPSYVKSVSNFGFLKWLYTVIYFKLRGWVFKWISILNRDPLNLHYLDSQSFLVHKVSLKDFKILSLVDHDWHKKVEKFSIDKRVFFGLTVFPEASIDYWVSDIELIDYEDIMFNSIKAFSEAGFLVIVKDHPQQFGFRQKDLIEKILTLKNVLFVPYSVSGNELLMMCGTNFSFTGTLGLQAALMGKKSIVVKNYYSTSDDFIYLDSRSDVSNLPNLVNRNIYSKNLLVSQQRIVERLLRGSFNCDFFSFVDFDEKKQNPSLVLMGNTLAEEIKYHQDLESF